jgi:hypothetical protein
VCALIQTRANYATRCGPFRVGDPPCRLGADGNTLVARCTFLRGAASGGEREHVAHHLGRIRGVVHQCPAANGDLAPKTVATSCAQPVHSYSAATRPGLALFSAGLSLIAVTVIPEYIPGASLRVTVVASAIGGILIATAVIEEFKDTLVGSSVLCDGHTEDDQGSRARRLRGTPRSVKYGPSASDSAHSLTTAHIERLGVREVL